jgi:DNA primase
VSRRRRARRNRIAHHTLLAQRQDAGWRYAVQCIGLIRESGHEHFDGRLIIPVFDEAGRVVEVYGRKLRNDLCAGTPKHLYLAAP